MARPRFAGNVDELAAALKPFASTPDFIKYAEELTAPLNVSRIVKSKLMWQAVYQLHPKLTFADKFMQQVFLMLAIICKDDWTRTMNDREVVMLRVRAPKPLVGHRAASPPNPPSGV